jgi:hypothetical protein
MTAYQNARAATPPQKGLTYSELLLDNIIGLDNDYLSAGEQLGQAFNADEIGFLKNAGISAYEGAKKVVADPIGAGEELLFGIYDSVENLATEDLDARLKRMYGIGYDQASEDQVTSARESVFGDAVTASGLIPGAALAGTGVKGLASLPFRGERRAQERIAELDALRAERQAEYDPGDDFEPGDDYWAAQDRMLARQTPIRELQLREAEGGDVTAAERDRLEAAGLPDGLDRLPSLLERVQRGDVLTDEEAFDVMTFERFGEDGVYDPTNTFERWGQQQNADTEGAARIAFLTGANTDIGQTPVTPVEGPYFQDNPAFQVPDLPGEAPFLAVEDMLDFHPDDINFDAPLYNAMGLMPDEADEYGALEDYLRVGGGLTETEAEEARAQLDELRETGRRRLAANRPFEVRPAVGQAEGIAGLYSPTRKAVDLLDRPSYDNLDSLKTQLLNRGAKPEELERLMAKIPGTQNNPMSEEQLESFLSDPRSGQFSKEDLARLADEVSQDVVVSTRTLKNSQDNPSFLDSTYFPQGAEDIGANVFEVPVSDAPPQAFRHFKRSSDGTAPVFHTRFGLFRSPGSDKPDTYHVGEIQSDWAQARQKLYPTREEYTAARSKLDELLARSNELENERKLLRETFDGETLEQFEKRNKRFFAAMDEQVEVNKAIRPLSEKVSATGSYGTRDEFDAKHPAPYVGTTSKWVQLGLRQSLLDAVNKGARRMTVTTGEQAQKFIGGTLEGQTKFYDDIVQKELEAVLKKFAKEAGIRKPEITTSKIVGNRRQEYMVPTVEFTDEFVEALKRLGMPTYAKGGIVKGSYLDNDPLEPALY